MATVTVEGSLTPCANLPTGVRKTVEYTDRVQRRISRGFYLVVAGPFDDDPEAPEAPAAPPQSSGETATPPDDGAPAGNATTEVWAEFLRGKGFDVPVNDEGETPGREELKRMWREREIDGGS